VVNLMAVWRAHGLAPVMQQCWEAGVILAGWSAAAYAGTVAAPPTHSATLWPPSPTAWASCPTATGFMTRSTTSPATAPTATNQSLHAGSDCPAGVRVPLSPSLLGTNRQDHAVRSGTSSRT
jgi:hypothetical protein